MKKFKNHRKVHTTRKYTFRFGYSDFYGKILQKLKIDAIEKYTKNKNIYTNHGEWFTEKKMLE